MRTHLRLVERILALWLVVAIIASSAAALSGRSTEAAYVALQPSDKLMHSARGNAAGVYRFAEAVGSYRLADTRAYIYEIYRLAPLVGLDPAILIAQSALETGYWKGKFWRSSLNPAGIGIYDDNQPTSFYWATGTNAARGHIYHLYTYAAGVPQQGHILYQYRHLTPGVQNVIRLGYAGTKTTIRSLEGSWALMSLYALGLCNKGNEILNFIERTSPTRTSTPTATPRAISTLTASDGNNPLRTTDRDLNTSWAVLGNGVPPVRGYLTYDLGEPIRLSTIKWVFRRTGFADYLSIRVSLDRSTWTTLKVVGNAPAFSWQTLTTSATARYVRFVFRNPNLDPDLGYLAEVAFNGSPAPLPTPTPSPTATATATEITLTGAALTPVGSEASAGSGPSTSAHDGNVATDWRTLASPPPDSAFVSFDLGGSATLTGARWYLSQPGCGTAILIEGSADNEAWTALATGNTTIAGRWVATGFGAPARFVRFQFQGPASTALGCLAEVEVWGTGFLAAIDAPAATATASATASPTVAEITSPTEASAPSSTAPIDSPSEVAVSPTATATLDQAVPPATETAGPAAGAGIDITPDSVGAVVEQ